MKAIAPETGVAVELVSQVPGLRPEADGAAERLMRRLTGDNGTHVVSYGTEAGLFQRGRMVDGGLRARATSRRRTSRTSTSRSANSRPASGCCAA